MNWNLGLEILLTGFSPEKGLGQSQTKEYQAKNRFGI